MQDAEKVAGGVKKKKGKKQPGGPKKRARDLVEEFGCAALHCYSSEAATVSHMSNHPTSCCSKSMHACMHACLQI